MPILLGGVFKLTNNQSPIVAVQGHQGKLDYMKIEIVRFIKKHGLTKFKMNPHFPVNTVQIMRGAVAAEMDGQLAKYADAVFRHMWEDGLKMDDPEVIRTALDAAGLDGARTLARIQEQEVKDKLLEEHGSHGRARHLRRADLLRRQGDLLRQGQAARRRGGDRGCEAAGIDAICRLGRAPAVTQRFDGLRA